MLEKPIPRQTFYSLFDCLRGNFGQDKAIRLRKIGPARIDIGLQLLFKPDRIDDSVFNRILWRIMKGEEAFPVVGAKSPVHALQMSR